MGSTRSCQPAVPQEQHPGPRPRPAPAPVRRAEDRRGRPPVRRRAHHGPRGGSGLGGCRRAAAPRLRPVHPGPGRALPHRLRLDQPQPPRRQGRLLPDPAGYRPRPAARCPDQRTLAAKLEIKDSSFAGWLDRELARRADVECVETMGSSSGPRRRSRRPGRSRGVAATTRRTTGAASATGATTSLAGPTSARSMPWWIAPRPSPTNRKAANEISRHTMARDAAVKRGNILSGLAQTAEFSDIDWQSIVTKITGLEAKRKRLTAASAALAKIDEDLKAVRQSIEATEGESQRLSAPSAPSTGHRRRGTNARRAGRPRHPGGRRPGSSSLHSFLSLKRTAMHLLSGPRTATRPRPRPPYPRGRRGAARQAPLRACEQATAMMTAFRGQYPAETAELDASIAAAAGFRELHARLANDDLPRFQHSSRTTSTRTRSATSPPSSPGSTARPTSSRSASPPSTPPSRHRLQPWPVHPAGARADAQH